jgi:O-antigen ligase
MTTLFSKSHNSGQTNIQVLSPLLLLLLIMLGLASLVPQLPTKQLMILAGGIFFFVVCLVSSKAAFYLLIFSMLLSPEFIVGSTREATASRGVTLRMDDFVLLIIGFSWLAKMAINKQLGLFLKTQLNKPIALYIAVCLISTLLGSIADRVDFKTGVLFVIKYFEYTLVYFMAVNHFQEKAQIRKYLAAMLVICVIVSCIGLAQIPQGDRISAPFEGESGEPNTLGGYLVLFIAISSGLLLTTTSSQARVLYGAMILLFGVTLVYTQSRSSYIALIPVALVFVWLSSKRHWVLFVLIGLAVLLPYVTPDVAKERMAYTFMQGVDGNDVVELMGAKLDTSTSARLISWKSIASNCVRHPILGFGVTGYGFVDSQYFRVLIETGFIGLTAFLLLVASIIRHAYLNFRKVVDPFDKGLCMGFIAALFGLLTHAISGNTFIIVRIMEPFWFVLAMVVMIPDLESESPEEHDPENYKEPEPEGMGDVDARKVNHNG